MPTYEYKGHQFSSDRELSADEWKQTLAHIDSLAPKSEPPKMGGFGAKKYFDETNPENPVAGLEGPSKTATHAAAYADIVAGLPGMGAGMIAQPFITGYKQLVEGKPFTQAAQESAETVAPLAQPFQSALKGAGMYSEEAAQQNLANQALGKLGEGVSYLGTQAAEATGIPELKPLTEFGINTAALGYGLPGAKKVGKIAKEKVIEPLKEKLTSITEADRAAELARRESVAAENRLYEPPRNVMEQRAQEAQQAVELEQRNAAALKELQAAKAEQEFQRQQQTLTAEPGETAQLPFTEEIKLPQGDLFEGGMLPEIERTKGISEPSGERTGLREAIPLEQTMGGKLREEVAPIEQAALPKATPLESAVDKAASGQKFAMSAEERIAFEKAKSAVEAIEPEFKTLSDKQILERMMDREWVNNAIKKSREMDAMYEDIAKRTRDAETRNEMLKNRELLADHLDLLEEQLRKMPTEKVGQGPKTREARMNEVAAGRQGIIQMRTFNPIEAAIESYKLAEPMMKKALEIMDKYGEEAAKIFINTYNQQEVNNKYNAAKTATVADVTPTQAKALGNLPWYEDKLNQGFVPVENVQSAIEALKGTSQDISDSALVGKFASGGVVTAALTNNPITRVGIQVVNGLKKQSERLSDEALNNKNDGILVKRQQIEKTLGPKQFASDFLEYVKSSLDKEYKPQYSDLGKEWVDNLQKKQKDVLDRANSVRESFGLKPIAELPNYFSLMREGPFGFIVRDAEGKMVSFVRERSEARAKQAVEFYKNKSSEEGLGWDIGNVEYNAAFKRSPFAKTARGTQLHMQDLIQLFGEENPNVAKAAEIYDKLMIEEANRTGGAHQRAMARGGLEGAKGTKEWVSDSENVKEGMQSVERYFRQMNDQIASFEAAKYLKDIIGDDSIQAPNAKALLQSYYDHAFNRVDRITEAMAGLNKWIEKTSGRDIGYTLDGIRVTKNALMSMTLGFANVRFLMTQLAQPFQVMPPMFAYLKSVGAKGDALPSMLMGFKDGMTYLAQQYTPHARPKFQDKLSSAIWDYAEKMHITSAQLLEQPREYSSQAIGKTAKVVGRIATGEMGNFESSTRMMAFSSLSRFLVDSGMPLEKALKTAENMTEFTMTSYEMHNKPQIYSHMGLIGEMASNLKTYQHNNLSQQAFYAKEALKGRPQAYGMQLGTTLFFAGALGLLGLNEIDRLMDWINGTFGTEMTTPSEFLVTKTPQAFAVGGLSSLTGYDFSSSFASQGVVPKSPTEAVFPLAGKVASIAQTGYRAATNPTAENLAEFARQPISSQAGMAEIGLTKKLGEDKYAFMNPKTRETEAIRTKGQVMTRAMTGLRPIEESIATKKGMFAKKDEQYRSQRRTELLKDIKENAVEVQNAQASGSMFRVNAAKTKNSNLINEYLKLGGSPTSLQNELKGHLEARGATTPLQRKTMETLGGQPTVEKALRLQKLMELLK